MPWPTTWALGNALMLAMSVSALRFVVSMVGKHQKNMNTKWLA